MSEIVEYEFGVNREQHIRSSEFECPSRPAELIWNQVAVLHDEEGADLFAEPGLGEMCRRLADRLNFLAEAVVRKTSRPREHLESFSVAIFWEASGTGNMLEIQSPDTKTCRLWPLSLVEKFRVVG